MESEQSCARLIKIINSLLDLSRIETGKLEFSYQDYDFAANFKTVCESNEGVFETKAALGCCKVGKGLTKSPLRPLKKQPSGH
ncbi:MAG: hypothetical protein EXQ58_07680 [Acidobacteria bacterium]|nr:hypothetical protein [Acidobacteriota bacterium]